jgi:hypothetical protein
MNEYKTYSLLKYLGSVFHDCFIFAKRELDNEYGIVPFFCPLELGMSVTFHRVLILMVRFINLKC